MPRTYTEQELEKEIKRLFKSAMDYAREMSVHAWANEPYISGMYGDKAMSLIMAATRLGDCPVCKEVQEAVNNYNWKVHEVLKAELCIIAIREIFEKKEVKDDQDIH